MKDFGLWGLFCQKATKSRSLLSSFSIQFKVELIILSEQHFQNFSLWKNNLLDNNIIIISHFLPFHFLLRCDTVIKVLLTESGGKSIRFITLQGGPIHTTYACPSGRTWQTVPLENDCSCKLLRPLSANPHRYLLGPAVSY